MPAVIVNQMAEKTGAVVRNFFIVGAVVEVNRKRISEAKR
jgi:hypothetical protein